jgi:hypothetical protein
MPVANVPTFDKVGSVAAAPAAAAEGCGAQEQDDPRPQTAAAAAADHCCAYDSARSSCTSKSSSQPCGCDEWVFTLLCQCAS